MSPVIAFLAGAAAVGVAAAAARAFGRRCRQKNEREVAESIRRSENLGFAGQLAGGLIHEIKNPLNTLSMNLQLLAEDWQDARTPPERRALKRIRLLQSETRRLAAILDDFLGFVRGHRLDRIPCDLNRLVDEVLTFVRPEMESGHIEDRTSYQPLASCRLDVNLIKQALLNLVLNAEQAVKDADMPEIIVRTSPDSDGARIDVIDTGRGIPPGDVERVFEAFYSTRKGGTGLGLPMTRRIVEEHGGRITVHSEPGRGTCFTITLPCEPAVNCPGSAASAGTASTEAAHG